MEGEGEKRDVRRPMNAFLIFCKRHRSMVREKNPDLDNRSVTRILGDLWANLKEVEKAVYTDLAKQYKDAFMKANPDYKWHNPDKSPPNQKSATPKPTNVLRNEIDLLAEGSIMPGKLADPSNMGGLSMLIMAGQQNMVPRQTDSQLKLSEYREPATVTKPPDNLTRMNQETAPNPKIIDNERAVEDAINKRLCESALKFKGRYVDQAQKHIQPKNNSTSEQSVQNLKLNAKSAESPNPGISSTNHDNTTTCKEQTQAFVEKVRLPNADRSRTSGKVVHSKGDGTQKLAGKDLDDSGGDTAKEAARNTALLQLAEMCSNALGHRKPTTQPKVAVQETKNIKKTTQDPPKPSVPVYKGILAEALLDTCSKGNYPNVIKGDSFKIKSEISGKDSVSCPAMENSNNVSDSNSLKLKDAKSIDTLNKDEILRTSVSEKSEISRILVSDVKEEKDENEESSMVTYGKMVVNHIIDKLYFSDLATAARKAASDKQVSGETQLDTTKLPQQLDLSLKVKEGQDVSKLPENANKNGAIDKERSDSVASGINEAKHPKTKVTDNNFDEHDGGKGQGQTKSVASQNKAEKYVSKSLKDKILSRVLKEKILEESESREAVRIEESENKCDKVEVLERDSVSKDENTMSPEDKTESKMEAESKITLPQVGNRKRTISQTSTNSEDVDGEDKDDFHPVRKSRRRNRGQRYQELINEGIIQPSKERMAAMHDSKNESCEVEDFQSIDSHILPETAIRRIRKRTISESDKGRLMSLEEAKRYKTGDFDLEAHIATLPACSIENLSKKRGFARQRHLSETFPIRKPDDTEEPAVVIDMDKTVSLPPHIKIPTPEKVKEPVTGSRKRKARKHSITHLLPAPTPVNISSAHTKPSSKDHQASEEQAISSQNCNTISQCSSLAESSTGQQTVSLDSGQVNCTEGTENENHSDLDSYFVDGKSTSGEPHVIIKDLEKECDTNDGTRSETDLNSNCKESAETVVFTGLRSDSNESTRHDIESLQKPMNSKSVALKSFEETLQFPCLAESESNDSVSAKHENSKHLCNMEDRTYKLLDHSDQCKLENLSVLSEDGSEKVGMDSNQSAGVKSHDLLKETKLLYSDDLVLENKMAVRSDKDHVNNNVCGLNMGKGVGKSVVEPFTDIKEVNVQYKDIYLQNKENVITTEGVKVVVTDCD